MGIGLGWTAPILKHLKNSEDEFSLNTDQCSWLAALPELGRAVGSVIVFLTIDVVGRKKLYVIPAIFYVISWCIVLFTRSVWTLYVARSIFGIVLGIHETTNPLYLAEHASLNLRGIFSSLSVGFYFTSMLVGFALSSFLSYDATALVITIVQLIVLLSMVLVKETAPFLVLKGRYDKAEDIFYWLRDSKSDETKLEYDEMVKNVQQSREQRSLRQLLSNKANYKSIAIVSILGLVLTFTGAGPMNSFVTIAFAQSATVSPEELTIFYGLVQLFCVLISSFYIERCNRRTILIIGLAVGGVSHVATAVLYYWHGNVHQVPYFTWSIFATIALYAAVCGLALYPIFFLTHGELFPQSVRGLGSCMAVIAYSVVTFLTALLFLRVTEAYGIYVNFVIFALMSVVTIIYVYIYLPEARGKSLAEIQKLFEK